MAIHIRRREFIFTLGGAAATWPLAARGQQSGKLPTIGFLAANPSIESQRVAAFVQRLRELAWADGRNLAIEYRWAEGRNERYAESAAEFVRLFPSFSDWFSARSLTIEQVIRAWP
jgi:putative tryptophan/tyrosine transport system substrate-binding protein